MRELCKVHGIPYDNDVDVNPSEFIFIDEHGGETDFIGFFEGTTLLAMYEGSGKLYAIVDIPSPPSSHSVELLVFERVQ
ncbi:MAG: hypothetical protein QXU60_04510 [Sulfolobales archaeon]|uniref:hypothetical protein n=1 Tax=Desulfurococcus sp. TaxID=51678 RepID=UPI00318135D4